MTDAFWNNLDNIITATALLIPILWTLKKVQKVETQTNSMNVRMVASAKTEGKTEGKAEVLETLAAVTPAIPLAITPVANDPKVMEWINMGIQIEAARRAAANGAKKAPDP